MDDTRHTIHAPSRPHDAAVRHVQGSAPYVDDIREPEGTLHLAPGFARDGARGRIVSVDLARVKAFPGVVRVLTAADIPGVNDCSPGSGDDPILAQDRIRFHGDVIFCVVAETREAARRAVRLAKIAIAAETPAVTVADALAMGRADVLPAYAFRRADPGTAIASAPLQTEGVLHIGGQEHFYLEGQAALAIPEEGGGMFVHSSTQHPTEVQHTVAHMLGLPAAAVTCACRRMGGGFGGKESQAAQWAALAALAAWVTGRPAKMRLDRDDDMIMTGKRHDFRVDWRCGHDASGRLTGVEAQFLARCGCSADLSQGVNDRTMFHADNGYYYPALHIHSRRLRTDTVSNTAFRGFGGPQGMLFAERMMDAIAARLHADPLDVRYANLYGAAGRDVTPYGQQVSDNILPPLMRALERTSEYRSRRGRILAHNAKNPLLRKGIALTPVKFGISFTLACLNQAGALVHLYTDGSVQVNHGGTEMGQGLYIKVASVVARTFGISLDDVRITATRTDKVPNTAPTAASSGSDLNGMAAAKATRAIRDRLTEFIAAEWQVDRDLIRFAEGRVTGPNGRHIAFADLARRAHLARVSLSQTGFYATPGVHWDRAAAHGSPFFYFAYGAACSEVTIDTLTGEMTLDRADILHDVGASLNPAIDIGQIEGGFVQGMGWLTTEELVYDAAGRLRTHAPSTYKIPTARDVPHDLRVSLWPEANKAETIYRSKAVGEPPVMLAISVWSAIHAALTGLKPGHVPPLQAPATAEAILTAVTAMTEAR